MIIDRKQISWGIGTALATLIVTLIYLANDDPALLKKWGVSIPLPTCLGPSPPLMSNIGATPLGLIYGTIALLIFLFAAFLGARRGHPTWPLGQIKVWLRAHVWLTIFTIPLVLFHCGFHGGGPMTQFLLWLYAFVMVSGFWGLFLQNVIPKLMREQLPEEVIFEQIPYIRTQLTERAKAIREDFPTEIETDGPVDEHGSVATAPRVSGHSTASAISIRFIDDEVLPYLATTGRSRSALRSRPLSNNQFRLLRLQVPEFMHEPLGQLQDICDEKRRLDLQTRFHYWLHGWLIFHAPASLLLVVLTIVHAVVAAFLYD